MSMINFFALGGIDEKGKNCFVLEVDQDIYIFDAGVKKPIISRLGIDTIIPSFDYLQENQKRVKAVFVSHIHDENFAALPWLIKVVPNLKIYASMFSLKVIRERLTKYQINKNLYKLLEMPKKLRLDGRTIHAFSLAHSVPGNLGFILETSDGPVAYTTDFIFNHPFQEFGKTDAEEIKNIIHNRKTLLWITDCSKGNMDGYASERSRISNLIYPYIAKAPADSRVIVGAYDEEMTAIHEIMLIAKKLKRPIALYGREYSQLFEEFCKLNPKFIKPDIIPYQKINRTANAIVIVTGKGERLYQRFYRILENNDVYLKIKENDRLLAIMSPINGHEKLYTKILDELARINPYLMEISASQFNKFQPRYEDIKSMFKILRPRNVVPVRGLHRYLNSTARRLAADYLIQIGFCHLLSNGQKLSFKDGRYLSNSRQVNKVYDVTVDGFGVGDVSAPVIREREQLSANGVVTITIPFNHQKNKILHEGILINDKGVFDFAANDPFYDYIKAIVIKAFNKENNPQNEDGSKKRFPKLRFNLRENQMLVRKTVLKLINKKYGKEPIIIPILYEI